jgi:hypothetical protein
MHLVLTVLLYLGIGSLAAIAGQVYGSTFAWITIFYFAIVLTAHEMYHDFKGKNG